MGQMVNLFDADFRIDPYPGYAHLRATAPAHRVRGPMGVDMWLITRYDDARAALGDPRLSKSPDHAPGWMRDLGLISGETSRLGTHLLSTDPPDHTRLRKLVAKAFTQRRVAGLRPQVQQIADDLIAAMPAGEVDLIAALAFPLPIMVICELLGVPAQDRDVFRAWSVALAAPPLDAAGLEAMQRARDDLGQYLAALIARTRRRIDTRIDIEDQPDLVSALVTAVDAHDRLSERELLGTLQLLLVAGHETTVNLIGNGMLALLRHRDQLELLRADRRLLSAAIGELLRYDSPVERATPRFATEDIRLGPVTIPAGSMVVVALASANRDPGRTAAAEQLDITRADHGSLAFGHGIHYCLGASLARLEAQIAIGTLLDRFPDLVLACRPEDLRWITATPVGGVRGVEQLPIRLR
jgi:cytochrome P450